MSITADLIYSYDAMLSDPDKQTAVTIAQSSSGTLNLEPCTASTLYRNSKQLVLKAAQALTNRYCCKDQLGRR